MTLKRSLPYVIFFLLSIIYFWPVLFGSAVLIPTNPKTISPWDEVQSSDPSNGLMIDSITLLYPWRVFNSKVLKSGEIPLWNPYVFCGYPHLAALQTNSLYPGTIPFDLIEPVRGIAGAMALHLAVSGVLMFLLLKRLGFSAHASFLGAITFEFNGMFLVRMSSPTYVFSSVWIPMMCIGAHALAEKLNFRSSLPLIFGVALSFLGGHPQIFLIAVVLTAIFFVYELSKNFSTKKFVRAVMLFAIACFAGLTLSSFQLFPFLELIRNSSRESVPLELYRKAAPPFVIAIQAVIPDFFGNPVDRNYWFNQGAELLLRGNKLGAPWSFNYSGENLFIGVIPLFLSAVALIKSRSSLTLLIGVLLFSSLAILFGTRILDAVYYLLPSFRFSRPDRVIVIYMFCISVLTAIGYQTLQQPSSERTVSGKWMAVAFGIFVFLILIPFLIDPETFQGLKDWISVAAEKWNRNPAAKLQSVISIGLVIAGAVLILLMKMARRFAIVAFGLMIFLPNYFFGWKFNPAQHLPLFPSNEAQSILSADATKEYYRIVRVFGRRGLKYFPSNVPSTLDVYDVNGASAAPINVYADFVRSIDARAITKEKYFWDFSNPRLANRPIFDFLNVKYVIADTTLPFEDEPLYTKNQFRIYKNPGYLSRFFLSYTAEPYKQIEQAQAAMVERKFNTETVLIPANQIRAGFLNEVGNGSVKIVSYRPNEIDLEVITDKNTILGSSEVYYPGWRAFVGGQPAEILLINTAFRGVYLPAGKHRVTFQFNSAAFRNGTIFSLLSLGAVLIIAVVTSRQNRNVIK